MQRGTWHVTTYLLPIKILSRLCLLRSILHSPSEVDNCYTDESAEIATFKTWQLMTICSRHHNLAWNGALWQFTYCTPFVQNRLSTQSETPAPGTPAQTAASQARGHCLRSNMKSKLEKRKMGKNMENKFKWIFILHYKCKIENMDDNSTFSLHLFNNPGVGTCLDLHVSPCSVHLQTAVFIKSQLSGRAWPGSTKSNRTESLTNDFGWMVYLVYWSIPQLRFWNVVGNNHVLYGKCLPEESTMASAMIITCFSNKTQNMIKHKTQSLFTSKNEIELLIWMYPAQMWRPVVLS